MKFIHAAYCKITANRVNITGQDRPSKEIKRRALCLFADAHLHNFVRKFEGASTLCQEKVPLNVINNSYFRCPLCPAKEMKFSSWPKHLKTRACTWFTASSNIIPSLSSPSLPSDHVTTGTTDSGDEDDMNDDDDDIWKDILIECIMRGIQDWKKYLVKDENAQFYGALNEEVNGYLAEAEAAVEDGTLAGASSSPSLPSQYPPESEGWLLNVTELLPFAEEASSGEKAELGMDAMKKVKVYVDKNSKARVPACVLRKTKKGRALLKRAERARKRLLKETTQHSCSGVVSSDRVPAVVEVILLIMTRVYCSK